MSLPIKGAVLMGPVSCVVKGWACVAKGEGTGRMCVLTVMGRGREGWVSEHGMGYKVN